MIRCYVLYNQTMPTPELKRVAGRHRSVVSRRITDQLDGVPTLAVRTTLEIWVDDMETAQAYAVRLADQAAAVLCTQEHVLFDAGLDESSIKGVFAFRRKPDMDVAEFQRYWQAQHGPLVLATPEMQRYVQCHVLAESYANGEPAYDGITEIYWPGYEAAVRSMASPEMTQAQASDASNFVASDSIEVVLMHEGGP